MFQKCFTIADAVLLQNLGEHIFAERVVVYGRCSFLFWRFLRPFDLRLGFRFCWLIVIGADSHGDHQGGS